MKNAFRKPKNVEPAKEKKVAAKPGVFLLFFRSLMDGSFLSRDASLKNVPFALFLAVVAGFYIANAYNAERTVRQTDRISKELKEYQSEYITLKSELMFRSNQSQVAAQVSTLGLKESKEPPFKIFASNTTREK